MYLGGVGFDEDVIAVMLLLVSKVVVVDVIASDDVEKRGNF